MNVGKRLSKDQPLTEHDVAERLDKAAARVLQIMMEVRQFGMMEEVKTSRYFTNVLPALAAELQTWGIEPQALRPLPVPGEASLAESRGQLGSGADRTGS